MRNRERILSVSVLFLCLSACLTGCGRDRLSVDESSDPELPDWVYGESKVYDAPTAPGGRIVDSNTGSILNFPQGGSGVLTIWQLESGPQTLDDEGAFEISYGGVGTVEYYMPHDPEDYDYLLGYSPNEMAILEGEEWDTASWLPLGESGSAGDTLIFELPIDAGKAVPWPGLKKFKIARFKKGTAHGVLVDSLKAQVGRAIDDLINALPPGRRAQARSDVAGPFKWTLYVPKNRSAWFYKSKPKYIPYWESHGIFARCGIQIPDDSQASLAHEVGHYFHHVLVGNAGFLTYYQNTRPSNHRVGTSGALNVFIEEPAYIAEYYLKGSISGRGPEKEAFLSLFNDTWISPMIVDFRDLEGMPAAIFASVIRERDTIVNFGNNQRQVPVVDGLRAQLWEDLYDIVAQGVDNTLSLRLDIEGILQDRNQADKLPAMLQAIGWSHHIKCRFVDGDGNPVSGVTARAISKVGDDLYELPINPRASDNTGTYDLDEFFPGSSILRIYHNGEEIDLTRTILWTTPTNQEVDFGDINLDRDELLRKLRLCDRLDFGLTASHTWSDAQDRDRHFAHNIVPIEWNGISFSAYDSSSSPQGIHVMRANGDVGDDGRILNVTYSYDWSNDQSGGTHTESHTKVTVTGLPYTRDYLDMGHQEVQYLKLGGEAAPYVTEIEATYSRSNAGGVFQSYEYISTDWNDSGTPARLDLIFGE